MLTRCWCLLAVAVSLHVDHRAASVTRSFSVAELFEEDELERSDDAMARRNLVQNVESEPVGQPQGGDQSDAASKPTCEMCEIVNEEECGVCHSLYMRECHIRMEANFHPVKVRECVKSPDCLAGVRRSCSTVYKSECSTKMEYRNMTEDHPVCNVERVETCKDDGKCSKVPVMRCNIQQRTVRKMQPSSECRRVPYTACKKSKCEMEKCFTRLTMRKEMEPKEECAYREKRICPQSTVSTDCRTRKTFVCKKSNDCPQDNGLKEAQAP